MTQFKTDLVNRLVALYGEQSDIVTWFLNLCRVYDDSEYSSRLLRLTVEYHEADPFDDDEDEEDAF